MPARKTATATTGKSGADTQPDPTAHARTWAEDYRMGLMLLRDHCESIRGTARKSGINGSYISAVRKGRVSKDVRTENWEKLLSALETYGGEVGRAWAAKRRPLLSPASLEAAIAAPLDHPAYRLAAWLRDRPGETEAVVAYAAAMLGYPRTAGEPVRVSGRRATT